jgi:hypothetical protein
MIYPILTLALYFYLDKGIIIRKNRKFNERLKHYFRKQSTFEFSITLLSMYFLALPAPLVYLAGQTEFSGKVGVTFAIFNSILMVFGSIINSQINNFYKFKGMGFLKFLYSELILFTFIGYIAFVVILNLALLLTTTQYVISAVEINSFAVISIYSIIYFFIFNIMLNKMKIDNCLNKIKYTMLPFVFLAPVIFNFGIDNIIIILLTQLLMLLMLLAYSYADK